MDELSLNEKSYLNNWLIKIFPEWHDYETGGKISLITDSITRRQRGLILSLLYANKYGELKEVLENVLNFQAERKV